jgi:hypothetical protein
MHGLVLGNLSRFRVADYKWNCNRILLKGARSKLSAREAERAANASWREKLAIKMNCN